MKFGGSSVADAAALARLCAIVGGERRTRVVVVSALAGVTDQLLAITHTAARGAADEARDGIGRIRDRHVSLAQAIRCPARRARGLTDLGEYWTDLEALTRAAAILRAAPPAARDAIVARGELASSRLVAAILEDAGVPAAWVDARAVVVTDARHERAVPHPSETAARASRVIAPLLRQGQVPVIGGFVASTSDGITTTLGRGGSDYSASLIGASLGASEIQIWTDTDGVLTADPRVLERARTVDSLSFREASALAHFGAKVLHPATVAPAVEGDIPVRILNAGRPHHRGTLVTRQGRRRRPLAGLACVPDIVGLDIALPRDANRARVLAGVFEACAAHQATVYLATVGDADVSIAIAPAAAAEHVAGACALHGVVQRRDKQALLVAVGDGLDDRVQVRDILRALEGVAIHAVSESSRSGYVAVVVPGCDGARAMAQLHARLFEGSDGVDRLDGRPFTAPAQMLAGPGLAGEAPS